MKKLIFILFFFNLNLAYANNDIAYMNLQYILSNSDIGVHYNKLLLKSENENKKKLEKLQSALKASEQEINNKKNILKKEELNQKIKSLNNSLIQFKKTRENLNNELLKKKKKYTQEVVKILNPILTNYVENNSILIVFDKKNIVVGKKTLDITNDLIILLNKETKQIELKSNDQ